MLLEGFQKNSFFTSFQGSFPVVTGWHQALGNSFLMTESHHKPIIPPRICPLPTHPSSRACSHPSACPPIHPSMHVFTHPSIYSPIYCTYVHSFYQPATQLPVHSFIHESTFICSFTSFIYSFMYPSILSLTNLPIFFHISLSGYL